MSNVKIFAKTIEETAKKQIDALVSIDAFKNSKVRIMPDVHSGAGCVIGFTADLGEKVIPNVVGVDIGCGIIGVNIGKREIDFERLDKIIRENIPSGMSVRETPSKHIDFVGFEVPELHCYNQLKNIDWIKNSIGTLGGGNHFIEVDIDERTGEYWILVHSGSRNLGKQVADIYQKIAIKKCNSPKEHIDRLIEEYKASGREKEIQEALAKLKTQKIPDELCYLEGEDREHYLEDMALCQRFANDNRMAIVSAILKGYFGNALYNLPMHFVNSVHNYIDKDNIVRKGAISAKEGAEVLIPINMRDGCILGIGKGNEDWNCSAPHGAGRLMSRAQAKKQISMEEYTKTMDGIYTTSVCENTVDEAPQAYKPLQEIVELIKPTVEIVSILKPVYNFKASE